VATKLFRQTRHGNQVDRDAFEQREDCAAIGLLKPFKVACIPVRVFLTTQLFARHPAFQQNVVLQAPDLLLSLYFIAQLSKVRCDFCDFGLAFENKRSWEFGQGLKVLDFSHAKHLAFDCLRFS